MEYRGVPLFEENGKFGVLVSPGFGAGWSTWGESQLAYDKRIIEFWLFHKDDEEFMRTVRDYGYRGAPASEAYQEAEKFCESIGFDECPYMGGFKNLKLVFVKPGVPWRITEYDGSESLETLDNAGFITFGGEE